MNKKTKKTSIIHSFNFFHSLIPLLIGKWTEDHLYKICREVQHLTIFFSQNQPKVKTSTSFTTNVKQPYKCPRLEALPIIKRELLQTSNFTESQMGKEGVMRDLCRIVNCLNGKLKHLRPCFPYFLPSYAAVVLASFTN